MPGSGRALAHLPKDEQDLLRPLVDTTPKFWIENLYSPSAGKL